VAQTEYEAIGRYVGNLVGEGDRLQQWVLEQSDALRDQGVMPIDPTRGRFLELIAGLRAPRRVLEIGSGAGYSALWFMKGMGQKGTVDTIEGNSAVIEVLRTVVKKAGFVRRIKIHQGPALEVLPGMRGPYDLIFIDADKEEYPAYLKHALRCTKAGCVILADNMFWGGATVYGRDRRGVDGIVEYTRRIFSDSRLCSIIIPLGDGLAVSHRIR
jgi:caffeoyl-CoA O-methyltransferase